MMTSQDTWGQTGEEPAWAFKTAKHETLHTLSSCPSCGGTRSAVTLYQRLACIRAARKEHINYWGAHGNKLWAPAMAYCKDDEHPMSDYLLLTCFSPAFTEDTDNERAFLLLTHTPGCHMRSVSLAFCYTHNTRIHTHTVGWLKGQVIVSNRGITCQPQGDPDQATC